MHRLCVRICLGLSASIAVMGCSTLKGGGVLPSAAGTASPITWESTAASPKTVVLVDTRTGENVFEMDIPLGQQLSVQFFQHKDPQKHPEAPDMMWYGMQPAGQWVGVMDDRLAVPHSVNRRIDIFLRSPERYTAPDAARPVVAYEVPKPIETQVAAADVPAAAAPQPTAPTAVPTPEAASAAPAPETPPAHAAEPAGVSDAAAPDTGPDAAPEPAPVRQPESEAKADQDVAAEPEPEATPEHAHEPEATPGPESASMTHEEAASEPKTSVAPPNQVSTARQSAMTWTDTGATRRISVSDMRTGTDVFEVDVPKGHDLVMHFYDMWTPPGADADVEAMHWQIVPAGEVVDVPAHHATVPSEAHRRVSERAVRANTPAANPSDPPDAQPEPATEGDAPAPPPVDLLDEPPTPS